MELSIAEFIELCQWDPARFLIFSGNVFAPLIYYSHFFTLISALLLGFLILIKNPNSPLHKSFFAITFLFSLWIYGDLVLWATEIPAYTMFFWTIINIAEPLIYVCSLLFFYIYINKKYPDFRWNLLLFILLLPTVLLAPTHLALTGYDLTNCNRVATEGPLASYGYLLEIVIALTIGFLAIKKIRTVDKESRKPIIITAVGLIFFLLSFAAGNITEVFTENWYIGQIGLIGMPIFLVLLTYNIVRFKTFNIKLIAAQALVWAIGILVVSQFLFIEVPLNKVLNSVTFILVLIGGYLLVKSVKKEIQRREEMAKMAEDVKRAYVIEKRAKEEIQKLDKFKDQFLMTAQHNLRTPLTSLMGYSDLLLNGTFGKQNKKTTEVIKKFQGLTNGMIRMVNDFLDMAQFQLGKDIVSLKPGVELSPILDEIINELKFKADSKGISLELKKPEVLPYITADREKLKAALFNVIDNSIKYTLEGGVTITVELNTALHIIIADTGIGISKERIEGLFNSMFERGEAAKKASTVGSGIGLYLAYQIIKSHKGTIRVESEGEGKGSVFYIELPLS